MFARHNKSITIFVITCTLTICTAAEAYDAWPSDFQWIYPQTLNKNSEIKFSWRFHISPSYYSFCEYKVELYYSKNQTLSSNDHLFWDYDTAVPSGVTGFHETVTVRPGSQGWTSLPETGTYYVFLKISPGWNAPVDTDTSDDEVMESSPIQIISDRKDKPSKATNPSPNNGAIDQPLNLVLSWSDGGGATSYDVYFGTDSTPDSSKYKGNQTSTTFNPGTLYNGTTYYWRVDAKNAQGTTTGDIWSFTTMDSGVGRSVMYVDDDAIGANNGTSWENAYNYLQDALAVAGSTSEHIEIWVAQGIYIPDRNSAMSNGNGDRQASFQLIDGVSLQGGYAGWNEPDPNARDIIIYETILSGDLNENDVDVNNPEDLNEPNRAENSYHAVTSSYTNSTAVLDGFTIKGGNANGTGPDGHGGGIYNKGGSPTLVDCTLVGNLSRNRGGGAYNEEGNPTLTNCTFTSNSSYDGLQYRADGGGMYNLHGNPTLADCIFNGNLADGGNGGGMTNLYSNPTLTGCIFIENKATWGGGMGNLDSNPSLTNCTFSINSVIYGGGMYNNGSKPNLRKCDFTGNLSSFGGAMLNYSSSPIITNCMFNANEARFGGGMRNSDNSYPTLINCTFSDNYASVTGGGIYNYSNVSTTLTNCILWCNIPNQISLFSVLSDCLASYSNIQGGWPGQGNINTNPHLVDPLGGDYHLKSQAGRWDVSSQSWVIDGTTSPCIDAGDPSSPVGDEPQPNGGRINMGAYGGTVEASKSP